MRKHGIPEDWSEYQIGDLAFVNPSQLLAKTDIDFHFFMLIYHWSIKGK
jgi:hypothetical protein